MWREATVEPAFVRILATYGHSVTIRMLAGVSPENDKLLDSSRRALPTGFVGCTPLEILGKRSDVDAETKALFQQMYSL